MSALLLPVLKQRFFDSNGAPLVGGFLWSYVAGTSTPAATYSDYSGSIPNTNPVVLDSTGSASVWLGAGAYKFILMDQNNVVQFSVDEVSVSGSTSGLSSPWIKNTVTDGQTATALASITVDFSQYTSAVFDTEIIRGTTVIANGPIAVQNLNGTGIVKTGFFMAGEPHGVTFSVSQVGMIAQLNAALTTGPGSGTIKMKASYISI
jgi:hypothetical protein